MDALLIFVVVVAVKLIDPATLVPSGIFGFIAGSRATAAARWLIIVIGAAVVTAAFAWLSWWLASQQGQRFHFGWAETAVASFLQVWLLSLAASRFRRRQTPAPAAAMPAPAAMHAPATTAAPATVPKVLYFKSSAAAFEYFCEYGRLDPLEERCLRLAIVEAGDMRSTKDGYQSVWVRVADRAGAFTSRAITAAPNVPPLKGGELVQWFAVKAEPRLAEVPRLADDPRSWWQSWIVAVFAPEMEAATGQFRVVVDYRDFAVR